MKILTIKSETYGNMDVLIDDDKYESIIKYKWHVIKGCTTFYARKNDPLTYMHRFIMSMTDPAILVDHKDHNGLNNQIGNLRIATRSENMRNRRVKKNSLTGYLGVVKFKNKWGAFIRMDGKNKYLGLFSSKEDAARAYDKAAFEHDGEFANLNFKQNS